MEQKPKKLKLSRAVLVEGKYDKIKLASLLDACILTTEGFGIFKNKEKLAYLKRIAAEKGLIVLTDADSGGLLIRNYVRSVLPPEQVVHLYIPPREGKERRKKSPGKEGLLGVEGSDAAALRALFLPFALSHDMTGACADATADVPPADMSADGCAVAPAGTPAGAFAPASVGAAPVCAAGAFAPAPAGLPVGVDTVPVPLPAPAIAGICTDVPADVPADMSADGCAVAPAGTLAGAFAPAPVGAASVCAVGVSVPAPASVGEGVPAAPVSAPVAGVSVSGAGDLSASAPPLTRMDFYLDGFCGGKESARRRKRLARAADLPENLSAKALLEAFNLLGGRAFYDSCKQKI